MDPKKTVRPQAAALAILAGMAIIGVIDNYVIFIAEDGGLWQFHFIRALMAIPMVLGIAVILRASVWPKRLSRVLLRSFFTASSMVVYFGCLAFLPLAQVVAGLFMAPIFVLLISVAFLGEAIGLRRILAVALGFAGVLIVIRPEAGAFTALSFVPIIAGLFYAIGAIGTRHWCEGESTLTLLLFFLAFLGGYGAVGLTVLTLFPQDVPQGADGFILLGWVAPTVSFIGLTFMQALGSVVAVGLLTRAYQWGEASSVAIFEYSLIIFGPLAAWILFDQPMTALMMVGIAAIILSGAIIALRSKEAA